MTAADRLREKAKGLRGAASSHDFAAPYLEREAVLLDLLADYVEALDDAGCDTRYDREEHRLVHSETCPRCSLLARIGEIA